MAKPRTPVGHGETPATDDALAFRTAVRDVKPLSHTPRVEDFGAPARARKHPRRRAAEGTPELDSLMPLIESTPLADTGLERTVEGGVAGADALFFQRGGVRTQVVRRLRRGLIPVEDELDLHGLSQTAAREQLAQFIVLSRDAGRRCVRIIHGKGYRSGARGPILKIAVNLWLRRHLDVMAFTSAKAIDGGTGALYVLLRA